MSSTPFWKTKALEDMNPQEWESLCDGCARCCLQKLEDEDTGEIHYTDIVCQYLDQDQCRCTVYGERSIKVPTCVQVTAEGLQEWNWLPTTCAYRLLAEGKDLEWWHPLVSGTQETVHEAGISVKHQCVSEEYVHEDEWQERVIRWVES